MSAASEYAELLKLVEVSGAFLSLSVFKETFPQGSLNLTLTGEKCGLIFSAAPN